MKMVYDEAIALIGAGHKIADAKTKLNSKYGLRGSQLALKMIEEHKQRNGLGARYEAVERLADEVTSNVYVLSGQPNLSDDYDFETDRFTSFAISNIVDMSQRVIHV